MVVMTWQFLFEAVPDPELEPRPLSHAVQVVQLQPVKCRHLTTKTHNLYKKNLNKSREVKGRKKFGKIVEKIRPQPIFDMA